MGAKRNPSGDTALPVSASGGQAKQYRRKGSDFHTEERAPEE